MNIRNIAGLTEQLRLLGFENTGTSLLKRICFKPDNFILLQRMEKGNDHLSFHLYFKKNSKTDCCVLMYYDAVLQKEIALPDSTINSINTVIDWKSAFEFDIKKQCSLEDTGSWEKEQKVESVIEDLSKLESTT